ncbi:spore protease YyaC [Inconstantimicrobium mannanitabidum]|uniref:Spore protease YyaC n=1 Tax=Inconstantimicrobium mannanitabidum TaxID=1604901 RepID=A0ACB5R7E0_9CLOT|nr:spore protease YyaC [Clostridium sp. TW13]GKX64956.1 spore protease YyaC [Clostridium sp. TW13]
MSKVKINYDSPLAYYELAYFAKDFINENTIIVCIGTDKFIGDCLGPLVGTLLKKSNFPLPVFGTLEQPCHALNIDSTLEKIFKKYPKANIIGIDACIGEDNTIGELQARDTPIHPGKGVGKSLPSVGNCSIIGIVDSSDGIHLFTQKNIRLSLVMSMSTIIHDALLHAYYLSKLHNTSV